MKKTFFYLLIITFFQVINVSAQPSNSVKGLISEGNAVFIEVVDKKSNTEGAYDSFKKHLLSEEWNRWELVDTKEAANFICRLNIDKLGMSVMSLSSMGARVRVEIEILNKNGESVWKSKRQQGNVSTYTGFDALSDAMRKVIRRSLKEELYGEKK